MNLIPVFNVLPDGADSSIPQSLRTAVNIHSSHAPYTKETEFALQDLHSGTGMFGPITNTLGIRGSLPGRFRETCSMRDLRALDKPLAPRVYH